MGLLSRAIKGIRAYHGSPHDFDRFDMSRIGTGEGAQAYGHGLYFAEAEDVARGYRSRLAGKGLPLRETVAQHLPESDSQSVLAEIYSQATNGHADLERAARSVQMRIPELRDEGSFLGPLGDKGQRISNAIADIRERSRGRMYEVNINANPEDFLDWDAPLSGQAPRVRQAANRILDPGWDGTEEWARDWSPTGESLIGPHRGTEAQRRSNILRDAGIPGIRYLDQGSRAAGEGSRNYVVFDDSLIEILRKYGIAGLMAGGAGGGLLSRARQEYAA